MEPFDEAHASPDPFTQFAAWFEAAMAADLPEPNAMTLATATPDGRPAARMVLLKGYGLDGFVFYTNYQSRKGSDLTVNPRAALILFWPTLRRQIRIEGAVEPVSAEQSDAYFHSRARGSQIAAAASPQSQVIPDRAILDVRVAALAAQYSDAEIPRPAHWGGYRVIPERIEFWQGGVNRLHDRLLYTRTPDGGWKRERLAP